MKKRNVRNIRVEEQENNLEPQEFDIYTDDGIFSYQEDDGISVAEEGFMIGYLAA